MIAVLLMRFEKQIEEIRAELNIKIAVLLMRFLEIGVERETDEATRLPFSL